MGVEELDTASPDVSAETLDDVVAAPAEADGATDAGSSSAPQAKDEKSVLSIVRDAVQSETPESSAGKERDPRQAAQPKEPDDENFSDTPFHQHPRFREVIRQRNELRPAAESYRKIESFLTENAISGEEFAAAVNLVALIKRDPEQAWKELRPTVQSLLVTIGEVLPPDLREKVIAGQMTQDVAKSLARERAKATIATGQMSFREQQAAAQQQRTASEQQAEKASRVRGAAREWEAAARSADADFEKKERRLRSEVLLLQREEGIPDTPEGVKAQLDKARKAVNAEFAAARPRRPGIQPVVGGSASGTPRAKPTSVLDIVRAGG